MQNDKTQTTYQEKLNASLVAEKQILLERKHLYEVECKRLVNENFWMIYGRGHQYVGF